MKLQSCLRLPVVVVAWLMAGIAVAEDAAMLELANARGCFICHSVVPDKASKALPLGGQEVHTRKETSQQCTSRPAAAAPW